MTDKRQPGDDERAALAAEHALRLLSGDEERRARALESGDPEFARDVARWRGRLAPLSGEVEPVEPPGASWSGIESAIGPADRGGATVIRLERRVSLWRGATAGMTALAATLAAILLVEPRGVLPPVQPPPAHSPMVAMLADEQKQMAVMASWDPAGRRLVLAVAGDMPADPAHAHQLWVIPAGGKARSLGVMGGEKQSHMELAQALAELMRNGAMIAISVEPRGGSPTGAPTGPVIASGALTRA
jgi:anti-sigma-K factor RskA